MATLSPGELRKRDNFKRFKDRISKGEGFTLDKDKKTKVVIGGKNAAATKKLLAKLSTVSALTENFKVKQTIILPTVNGGLVKLNSLYKDAEFAGRTQASTAKEDYALALLREGINTALRKEGTDFIIVRINNVDYKVNGITTQRKVGGDVKSDFNLTYNRSSVVWISHKDGGGVKGFQQWGGVTSRAGAFFASHPEVLDFAKAVKAKTNGVMPPATTYARPIKDAMLRLRSIYGPDYGTGSFGFNSCTVVLQGDPILLRENNGKYTLKSDEPFHYARKKSGVAKESVSDSYQPTLMAIYKGDRSNFDIRGARFAIQPRDSRNVTEFI